MSGQPAPRRQTWIVPGRAYPGWGWVAATAGLWLLFALLLLAIGELQRGFDQGAVTRIALGYYATAAAVVFVALHAFLRRPWAQQLAIVSSVPMLLLFPVGTVVAGLALRALLRHRAFYEVGRS
jgi:hypothetical protein